jgi:hypothetical protein
MQKAVGCGREDSAHRGGSTAHRYSTRDKFNAIIRVKRFETYNNGTVLRKIRDFEKKNPPISPLDSRSSGELN